MQLQQLVNDSPFHFKTEQSMQVFGRQLASYFPQRIIVTLSGELGSGKSVLVRSIIQSLGFEGRVKSPTYTLIETYQVRLQDESVRSIAHLDLYRLSDPSELHYLAIDDVLAGSDWVFIEWPEQGAGYLPEPDLQLKLEYENSGRQLSATLTS